MRQVWDRGALREDRDAVVTELPVALVYNGISHAVMMATPTDLEDFALGFSLSEGIVRHRGQVLDMEVSETDMGVELALTISAEPFAALKQYRRSMVGRTGCGLCGVESLAQAVAPAVRVHGACQITHGALQTAAVALGQHQSLKRLTGGVHAAAWCTVGGEIQLLREDVGRHNALDKVLGALQHSPLRTPGFVLVTSRASYEMVAKSARCNIAVLAAVSAPTSLAVQQAQLSGVTLVGFLQPGRQVIYANGQRLVERL